jgi:hypothetical protein
VNGATLKQKLLSQRCFTRIGVGDNGKGSAVERHTARLRDD